MLVYRLYYDCLFNYLQVYIRVCIYIYIYASIFITYASPVDSDGELDMPQDGLFVLHHRVLRRGGRRHGFRTTGQYHLYPGRNRQLGETIEDFEPCDLMSCVVDHREILV